MFPVVTVAGAESFTDGLGKVSGFSLHVPSQQIGASFAP